MANIQIKSFLCSKGDNPLFCQDRIAMDASLGCFVVADGVSNSYHPEIMSEAVCSEYLKYSILWNKDKNATIDIVHQGACLQWQTKTELYEAGLSGRQLKHAMDKRLYLPAGATTMAGVIIGSDMSVHYDVLGDSSLILFDEEREQQRICTCKIMELDGRREYVYDNHPSCMLADGSIVGRWTSGEITLSSGFMVLATDGAAEWMQTMAVERYNVIGRIWNMDTHDDFQNFVMDCRKDGHMDDDIAVVILKINKNQTEDNTIAYEYLHHEYVSWEDIDGSPIFYDKTTLSV